MTSAPHSPSVSTSNASLLDRFRQSLEAQPDPVRFLAEDLIGAKAQISGPFGRKDMVYADYVASGRALGTLERFVLEEVLPFYANSHTEASYCGGFMTRLRREARSVVAELCGAGDDHAVIFTGSGATAGLNRLVELFGVRNAVNEGRRVRVLIGPYEHHSNILPWRESGAELVELPEAADGGPDLAALDAALREPADLTVCSFSAASNVTGILVDVAGITARAKSAGAKVIWDYACAGPYVPIAMTPAAGAEIDAIVTSPHKFIGGPGASGLLILRKDAPTRETPTWPGGGTVKFVSPAGHDYSGSVEAREEAGTPNVVGDIRVALTFIVKDVMNRALGEGGLLERNLLLARRALAAWKDVPNLEILGLQAPDRLPILSFRVRKADGGLVHQQLVTRMLSDRFGIQARGGCACAGPYVHRLLGIDDAESETLRAAILSGDEMQKPGFIRLNFSPLMSEEKVQFVLDSVAQLAADAEDFEGHYDVDPARAIFFPRASATEDMAEVA